MMNINGMIIQKLVEGDGNSNGDGVVFSEPIWSGSADGRGDGNGNGRGRGKGYGDGSGSGNGSGCGNGSGYSVGEECKHKKEVMIYSLPKKRK